MIVLSPVARGWTEKQQPPFPAYTFDSVQRQQRACWGKHLLGGRLVSEQEDEKASAALMPHCSSCTPPRTGLFCIGYKNIKIEAFAPKCCWEGFEEKKPCSCKCVTLSSGIKELVSILWFNIKVEILCICVFTWKCVKGGFICTIIWNWHLNEKVRNRGLGNGLHHSSFQQMHRIF